ncbi:MAG TPA: hypothetical protein VGZ22_00020 [Isosphaeraceae bacterium]|jgi:hypothetical protein|nr:hypothetical protein [Isosphaeraceae bacterium]
MHLRGIVQSAELQENPPGSDTIEMLLRVQGVGPGQPRKILIPFELLLLDPSLDPESVTGHGFEAEVEQTPDARWVISMISFASSRVLRAKDE